jgi:hypothetical protein
MATCVQLIVLAALAPSLQVLAQTNFPWSKVGLSVFPLLHSLLNLGLIAEGRGETRLDSLLLWFPVQSFESTRLL